MAALPIAPKQVGPRSLQRMCLAVVMRNISSVTDVGELPFETVKPILKQISDPAQLHELEVNCAQLRAEPEQMGAIWTRLLQKRFPKWDEKGYAIDDAMPWFEVYNVVKEAVDRDNAAATAMLQEKLAGMSSARSGNSTQIVNSRALLSKLPGSTAKRRGVGAGPSFTFGGGTRTKMTTGQSVLRRARREAREISKVSALSTPTGALRVAQGQIRRAPEAMVNDYRVAHNPPVLIRPPKKRSVVEAGGLVVDPAAGYSEHEERLLRLKKGAVSEPKLASVVRPIVAAGASARPRASKRPQHGGRSDDDDDDDDDDLFGDEPKKKPRLTVDDLEDSGGRRGALASRPRLAVASKAASARPSAVPQPAQPRRAAVADKDRWARERSPAASAPPTPVRKKGVDIFMRPKRR